MPTQLNYVKEHIRNKTNTKMIYIGHSMGTTLSYQYSAARPMEAQDNVCGFISLAPITFFDFSKFAAPMVKPMDDFLQFILGVCLASKNLITFLTFEIVAEVRVSDPTK